MKLFRTKYLTGLFCIAILLFFSGSSGNQQNVDFYDLQIAMLEKFTRYIDWPNESSVLNQDKFIIGIIGDKDFYQRSVERFSTIKIKNKLVEVHFLNSTDYLRNVNMLYVGDVGKKTLEKIIASVMDYPILTVSFTENFAEFGVCINMYFESNKVKFEINEYSLKKQKLSINTKLLQLAKIINR